MTVPRCLFFLSGTDGRVLFTDLFFLKGLLDLLQIGQQADISADLDADGGKEPVHHGRRVCRRQIPVLAARWQQTPRNICSLPLTHLVNGCSQTGQSGDAVHVNLAAVRLSSHQVGSVSGETHSLRSVDSKDSYSVLAHI